MGEHVTIFEGFLKKKGDKRWFVLHDDCIMWYKSEKKSPKELVGVVPLEAIASVSDVIDEKKTSTFSLAIRAGTAFQTLALSTDHNIAADWVKIIKEVLFVMPGKCDLKLDGKFWKETDLMLKLRSKFTKARLDPHLLAQISQMSRPHAASDVHPPSAAPAAPAPAAPVAPDPAAAAAAAAALRTRVASTTAVDDSSRGRGATIKPDLSREITSAVLRKHTDWLRVKDETSGAVYFVNVKTKESVWQQPADWSEELEKDLRKQLEQPKDDKKSPVSNELQQKLAQQTKKDPTPASPRAAPAGPVAKTDWIRREHTNGVFYWANPFTQESSWTQPADWSPEGEEELLVRLGIKQAAVPQATESKAAENKAAEPPALHPGGPAIGDRIWLQTNKGFQCGVLRFLGKTSFREGDWIGAELDDPIGLNDGSVNGVHYFTCKPKYGMFCRPENVLPFGYSLGDRVYLQTNAGYSQGTLRFFGKTKFQEGDWLGVGLDAPTGLNDGTVQGVKYFSAEPKHGLFARPSNLLGFDTNGAQYAEVRKNTPWIRRKDGEKFFWVDPMTKQSSWTQPAEWVDLAVHFKKAEETSEKAVKKVEIPKSQAELGVQADLAKIDAVFSTPPPEEEKKKWQYVAPRSKDRVGPITVKDLIELIKDEKVTRSYYFFGTGMKEWTPGIGIPELTPFFKAVEEKKKKAAELKALKEKRAKEEAELNAKLEREREEAESARKAKEEEDRKRAEEEEQERLRQAAEEARVKEEEEKLKKMNLVEKLEYLPRAYVSQILDCFKNKRVECKKLLKEEKDGKVDYLVRVLVNLIETSNPNDEKPYAQALESLWEIVNYPMIEFDVRDAVANVIARDSGLMKRELCANEKKQNLFVLRLKLVHLVLTGVKREAIKALDATALLNEMLSVFKWSNISMDVPPLIVAITVHLGLKKFIELKHASERDFVTAFLEFYQESDMVAYFTFVKENFIACQHTDGRSFLGLKDTRPLKAGIVKVVQKELAKHKKYKSKAALASKSNLAFNTNTDVNKALLTDDWIMPILMHALEAVKAMLQAQIADPVHLSGDAEEEQAQEKLIAAVSEIKSEAEQARLPDLELYCTEILAFDTEVKILLFRKWTNKAGISVVMKFLHVTNSGEVFFQQPNRKAAHVPLDTLCPADQKLLQEHEAASPKERKEESLLREFRSLTGTKRQLLFVTLKDDIAIFQRSDQKFLAFPLSELSLQDQEWIKGAPGQKDITPVPIYESLPVAAEHLEKTLPITVDEIKQALNTKKMDNADKKLLNLLSALEEGAEGMGQEWEWKTVLSAQKHIILDFLFMLFAEASDNKLTEGSGESLSRAASILLVLSSCLSILPATFGPSLSSPHPAFANGVGHHLALLISTPGQNWPDRKILPNLKLMHSILVYCGRLETLDLPPIDKLIQNLFTVLAEYQTNKLVFDPFVEVLILANASRPAYNDLSLTLLNTHRDFPEYDMRDAMSSRVVQIVNQELENRPEHFQFAMLYFVSQAFYPPETKEDREGRRKAKLRALAQGTVASAEMPLRAKEFSELFYTNDIFVLQDIISRMLMDTNKDDVNSVHLFQRALAAMVAWIEYPRHKHKPELVVEALTNIAESYGDPFTATQLENAPASQQVPLSALAMAHTPESIAAVLAPASPVLVHEYAIKMLHSFKVLVGLNDEF